jgi:hypothetical protein
MLLLRHLEGVGFRAAPRVIGNGFSEDGREKLSLIAGESPHPGPRPEGVGAEIGQIMAALHDAVRGVRPPPDALWHPSFARDLPHGDLVIGHGDTGPWNWIARHGHPDALIDWEYSGPVDPMWELAEVVWLNAQLHDDDVAERQGLGSPRSRALQTRSILDAAHRQGYVGRMIEFAVQSARADALNYDVEPETASAVSSSGFPVLWAITWRVRSAAWMMSNRQLLESIVE